MHDRVEGLKAETAPALGISISHQVGEDRNLVFQSHLPQDCDASQLNDFLDKAFKASERQRARVRLPQAIKLLSKHEKLHARSVEDVARLDAERDAAEAEWRAQASASDRRNPQKNAQRNAHEQRNSADRANAMTTITRIAEEIAALKEEIADLGAAIAADD